MTNDFPSDKSQRERLDKLCDRFEAAWIGLPRLTIEEVLRDAAETDRSQALWMLVELEVDYRWRDGETPTLDEYTARFPELNDRLPDLFLAPTMIAPQTSIKFLPKSGERLGNYELLEELGKGGMGIVFKARQLKPNRLVALKMILAGSLATKEMLDRFRNEADAAAKLDHSGIVPVYEVDEADGIHFYSMGLVEGESLAKLVQSGPLPPREAAEMVRQIANAVHYAHERGVIHRDLKPANILLARGSGFQTAEATPTRLATDSSQPMPNSTSQVGQQPRLSGSGTEGDSAPLSAPAWEAKVTDFGLAKLTEIDSGLTATGHVIGTPSYMPPEQARGDHRDVGRHSDVYSLGAILYCLLLGHPPFRAASAAETLRQVIDQEPAAPRQLNPALPRDLETICLKCLQKEPTRRYASAHELAEELGRYLRREPILARPINSAERLWRWAVRNPVVASLGALILLLTTLAYWRESAGRFSAQQALAESYFDRALEDFQTNEIGTGLLRLNAAFNVACPRHPEIEQVARMNLSAWKAQFIKPNQILQHDGDVRSVAVSPDGRWILTGCNGIARLWDVATGEMKRAADSETSDHLWVAFDHIGDRFVTLTTNGRVQFWDAATGKKNGPEIKHPPKTECHSIALSPDDTLMLTADSKGIVRKWDVERAECVGEWNHYTSAEKNWVYSVAFHHSGEFAITCGRDHTAKVWDVATGELKATLPHQGYVLDARFLKETNAITASIGYAQEWKLDPVRPLVPTPIKYNATIFAMDVSLDGSWILTGGDDKMVRLWGVTSSQQLAAFRHEGTVRSIAFSRDGTFAVTGADDKTARVWRLSNERAGALQTLPHQNAVSSITYSRDGRRSVTASHDGMVKVWNSQNGEELHRLQHEQRVTNAVFSPDGSAILTVSAGKARLWEANSGQLIRVIAADGFVRSAIFDPDASRIVIGADSFLDSQDPSEEKLRSDLGIVTVWDATGDRRLRQFQLDGPEPQLLVRPGSGRLVTTNKDKSEDKARLWDLESGKLLAAFPHRTTIKATAWSADGKKIATGEVDGTAHLWNVTAANHISLELQHDEVVNSVAFSADSRWLLTGGRDRTARLWDVTTGKLVRSLQHREEVHVVAFHPNGQVMVTGDNQGAWRLWHVASGRQIGPVLKHDWPAHSADFSPDGRTLATAALDNEARFWRLPEPIVGTPEEVRLEIETLTGMELDANRVLRQLDTKTIQERRLKLEKLRRGNR